LRNSPTFLPPNATTEQFQALFIDFFNNFDAESPIAIRMSDSANRNASLRIFFDPNKAITAQRGLGFQPSPVQSLPPVTIIPLAFDREDFEGNKNTLYLTVNQQGMLFQEPGRPMGIVSGLISSGYFGGVGENAQLLSQLSVQKRSDEVIEAVRRHFPFIRQVTSETIIPGLATVL
jgi:hypothetical protein